MRLSGRKTRCVCVVLALVLLSMLGALIASNSLLNGPVLRVAAQTAPAASHTTVSNDVPNTAFPAALSAVVTLPVNAVPVYVNVAVVACLVALLPYVLARRGTEGRPCVKTWTWTVTPPRGNSFTLTGETPTFIPEQIGVYQVSLVVTDTCGASSTNTSTINVTVNKKPPIADAGPDQTDIHRGDTVTLDGSGSADPDAADTLTYAWTVTPPRGNSFTLTGETPTFIPDQIGIYQVSLIVTDNHGASSTNTATVTVNKKPPIADAGPAQTDIHRGDTVTLDGSGSADPDAANAITSRDATLRERFSRWTHRRAPRQNERTEAAPQPSPVLEREPSVDGAASRTDEPTKERPEQTPMAQQERAVEDKTPGEAERAEESAQQVSTPYQELLRTSARDLGAVTRARELFGQGKDRQAINALYSAVMISLFDTGRFSIASSMTHWEKYDIIQAAMPDVRAPLRTLTIAYERTAYARASLTEDERIAAVEACKSIHQHVKSLEGGR